MEHTDKFQVFCDFASKFVTCISDESHKEVVQTNLVNRLVGTTTGFLNKTTNPEVDALLKSIDSFANLFVETDEKRIGLGLVLLSSIGMYFSELYIEKLNIVKTSADCISKMNKSTKPLPKSVPLPDKVTVCGVRHERKVNGYFEASFHFIEHIAKGAFGEVVKVRNRLDKGIYAVKKIKIDSRKQKRYERRLREVVLWKNFSAPNIAEYKHSWIEEEVYEIASFEKNRFDRTLYIQMKFYTFILDKYLLYLKENFISNRKEIPLDLVNTFFGCTVVLLFKQIINGVAYLHEKGVIHRDINPQNIFINSDGLSNIAIGDFGLCVDESCEDYTSEENFEKLINKYGEYKVYGTALHCARTEKQL